jgi:hypothetical protein
MLFTNEILTLKIQLRKPGEAARPKPRSGTTKEAAIAQALDWRV